MILIYIYIYINLERKFYKKSTKHALFNDTGCWAVKKQHVYAMNVIEIKNINMEKRKKKKKIGFQTRRVT